jgi:uncharacterized protein (TIGR02246 family)
VTTDREAIHDLLAAYALTLDAEDIEGCVALFTDDAEFVVFGSTVCGRDALREMFIRAPHGIHLTGMLLADIGRDTATARAQVLFVNAGTHELRLALYDDELTKVNGQWRFRRRRCRFITADGLRDSPGVQGT